MPAWIHNRADHIRSKNPSMPKSEAFAIATQQAYAAKKAPSGYGTPKGRHEAHKKYDEPKSHYTQTADPSHKSKTSSMSLAFWMGLSDELSKIATAKGMAGPVSTMGSKKSTLTSTPKLTSRPVVKEPEPPASVLDQISSARTIQPPPVTAGVY